MSGQVVSRSRAVRRSGAPGRLSADVKSGLCWCLKWRIAHGSHADSFYLKVPTSQREVIAYLRTIAEPCAEYMDLLGIGRDALQWRLPMGARAIWRAAGEDISDD